MSLSTHVLDATTGHPAVGVPVTLEVLGDAGWLISATAVTDEDGRVREFPPLAGPCLARLTFDTGVVLGPNGFFPEVSISFRVGADEEHLHVPLLLSPYAYSTYRGS